MNYAMVVALAVLVTPGLMVAQHVVAQQVVAAQDERRAAAKQQEFLTMLGRDQLLSSELIGSPVRALDPERVAADEEGETLGEVKDLVLGGEGAIEGVIIGVGGFLGIGERDIGIGWQVLEILQDPDEYGAYIVLANVDPEAVRDAPAFEHAPEVMDE